MGLKDEIFEALVGSIQPDNPGEDFIFSDAGINKVDTLAEELSAAIVKWVKAQTFTITKLNASQAAVATTPAVLGAPSIVPMITVKIDDQGQGVDNPIGGGKVESMNSSVQLKNAINTENV